MRVSSLRLVRAFALFLLFDTRFCGFDGGTRLLDGCSGEPERFMVRSSRRSSVTALCTSSSSARVG